MKNTKTNKKPSISTGIILASLLSMTFLASIMTQACSLPMDPFTYANKRGVPVLVDLNDWYTIPTSASYIANIEFATEPGKSYTVEVQNSYGTISTSLKVSLSSKDSGSVYYTDLDGNSELRMVRADGHLLLELISSTTTTISQYKVRCAEIPSLAPGTTKSGGISNMNDSEVYWIPDSSGKPLDYTVDGPVRFNWGSSGLTFLAADGTSIITPLIKDDEFQGCIVPVPGDQGVFVRLARNDYYTFLTYDLTIKEQVIANKSVGDWVNDNLKSGEAKWYSLPVTANLDYLINTNDASDGDSTKTASIKTSVIVGTQTSVNSASQLYTSCKTVSPGTETQMLVRIANLCHSPVNHTTDYTYAFRMKSIVTQDLSDNAWFDSTITRGETQTYRLAVSAGDIYQINWDDYYGNSSGTKTAKVYVSATNADGTVTYFDPVASGYSAPKVVTANADGYIKLFVTTDSDIYSYPAGSFSVRIKKLIPTVLSDGTWSNNSIANTDMSLFSMNVLAGETYTVNWDDYWGNPNGGKTANIKVTAVNEDGTITYFANQTSGFSVGQVVCPTVNGKIKLKVSTEYSSTSVPGSYALRIKRIVPTLLADNTWADTSITAHEHQIFKIPVTAGETYVVNWNDYWGNSSGGKTASVYISASNADSSITYFSDQTDGYNYNRCITPVTSGYIKLVTTVYGSSSTYEGTYAVRIKKLPTTTLANDTWFDSSISAGEMLVYQIPVTAGSTYAVNWNDYTGYSAGSKTASIRVDATNADKSKTYFMDAYSCYAKCQVITPVEDGYLSMTVRVYQDAPANAGTFGIKVKKIDPTALSDNTWTNASITAVEPQTFSMTAVAGETYQINWDDHYGNSTGGKTGDIAVTAYNQDCSVKYFTEQIGGYSVNRFIHPTSDGIIKIVVIPEYGYPSNAGTYGIKIKRVVPLVLSDNAWSNETTTAGQIQTFTMAVTPGDYYEIKWNDYYGNPSGGKTGSIWVDACNGDGTVSYFTHDSNRYNIPRTILVGPDGFLKLKVTTFNFDPACSGTYAVKARRLVPTALTENTWTNDTILAEDSKVYTMAVESGETYRVNWDDGFGTNSGYVQVTASSEDGSVTFFSQQVSGYSSGRLITAHSTGKIKLRVWSYVSGTFGVRFDHLPTVTLTEGTWYDGSLSSSTEIKYFKIPVDPGYSYQIKWNDKVYGDGKKTADINVSCQSNSTSYINENQGNGYSLGTIIYPASTELLVTVRSSNATTGTFGLKVTRSTGNAPVTLTENTWKTSSITDTEAQYFYVPLTGPADCEITCYETSLDTVTSAFSSDTVYFDSFDYCQSKKIHADGPFWIKIQAWNPGSTGTFKVRYALAP